MIYTGINQINGRQKMAMKRCSAPTNRAQF
jgi:hypothetical protein